VDFDLVETLRVNAQRPVCVSMDRRTETPTTSLAFRDAGGLVHLRQADEPGFDPASLEIELRGRAGETVFAGARIRWRVCPGGRRPALGLAGREMFDAERVGKRVVLRHWRPGDRFQPIGMAAPVKLQDLFTNQKILRKRRHQLIVAATAQGEVFWVEGLRISERFKLTKQTKRRLEWRWQRR
jgi:tRNA(Ile)-lysidine synthase